MHHKREHFKWLKKLIVVFVFLIGLSTIQAQKPNIVFIMTDDQSAIPLRNSDDQNQSLPFDFNGDTLRVDLHFGNELIIY